MTIFLIWYGKMLHIGLICLKAKFNYFIRQSQKLPFKSIKFYVKHMKFKKKFFIFPKEKAFYIRDSIATFRSEESLE